MMIPTSFNTKRRQFHEKMAVAYLRFLDYVFVQNPKDFALHKGLREARNKFLSCYFYENVDPVECFPDSVFKKYQPTITLRYLCADYYSVKALKVLRKCEPLEGVLRYEHLVPKGEFVQDICEEAFRDGKKKMTITQIATLLDQRWHMAVIHKEEDKLLKPRKSMPDDWLDGDRDVLARYKKNNVLRFPMLRSVEDAEQIMSICSV
jgi:hypothetical protein